jgi:hypothetical protein
MTANMRYIIIDASDLDKTDFTKTLQTSRYTVRYSIDKTKVILKYAGEQPSFVYGISGDSVGLPEYTHEEIYPILQSKEWKM